MSGTDSLVRCGLRRYRFRREAGQFAAGRGGGGGGTGVGRGRGGGGGAVPARSSPDPLDGLKSRLCIATSKKRRLVIAISFGKVSMRGRNRIRESSVDLFYRIPDRL